jgi:hypothetical protein
LPGMIVTVPIVHRSLIELVRRIWCQTSSEFETACCLPNASATGLRSRKSKSASFDQLFDLDGFELGNHPNRLAKKLHMASLGLHRHVRDPATVEKQLPLTADRPGVALFERRWHLSGESSDQCLLRQDILDELAVDVRETEVAARGAEGETLVVEAQQVQDRSL